DARRVGWFCARRDQDVIGREDGGTVYLRNFDLVRVDESGLAVVDVDTVAFELIPNGLEFLPSDLRDLATDVLHGDRARRVVHFSSPGAVLVVGQLSDGLADRRVWNGPAVSAGSVHV